jgi:RsmE family RNA methyltransferase
VNLLLFEPEDFVAPDRARISGRRLQHVQRVLGKAVGDTLLAGRIGGSIGEATIVSIEGDHAELECRLDRDPPAPSRVTLVLALPRPPMLRRILQHATAMGVKTIALVHAARVEKSFWDGHDLRPAAIAEKLRLGLEQAGDTIVPSVTMHRRFRPFVEDELPALAGASHRLVAHAAADVSLVPPEGEITLAIGPEGGWVPFELDRLGDQGFVPWSLGRRVLRVETAVVAALGRLV